MSLNIETLLAHLSSYGDMKDPYGATHFPIYQTATYDLKKQDPNGKMYDYTRSDNPTREALENIIAKGERAVGAICTHTGIGAVALVLETVLKSGSVVLVEEDLYGGTYRLLQFYKDKYNVTIHFVDFTDLEKVEHCLQNNHIDLVLCESPTNPGLKIIPLHRVALLSKQYGALFAVDNSLATFASQQPLELGANISFFSTTKYISGHGSVTAGAVATNDKELLERLSYCANAQGRSQNPFDVYCISLGLPTLYIRLKAHEEKAYKVAQFLEKHDKVVTVKFPGLESHPQHELARGQMYFMPGVITIDLISVEVAEKLVAKTKLFGEKASFGAADSRIEIPSKISHASFSEEDLAKIGLTKSTVRLSIGLENVDDIIDDLEQGLE